MKVIWKLFLVAAETKFIHWNKENERCIHKFHKENRWHYFFFLTKMTKKPLVLQFPINLNHIECIQTSAWGLNTFPGKFNCRLHAKCPIYRRPIYLISWWILCLMNFVQSIIMYEGSITLGSISPLKMQSRAGKCWLHPRSRYLFH